MEQGSHVAARLREPLIPPDDPIEETADGCFAILAWQGDPVIKATCNACGDLKLSSVSVSALQLIDVPRHWDDSEREPDPHPHAQLRALLARTKAALFAWGEVMDHFCCAPGANSQPFGRSVASWAALSGPAKECSRGTQ